MPKVRTRMQPDTVIDVPDDEYEVLRSGGLLAADPEPPAKAPAAVQPTPATPKATDAPSPAADTTTTTKKG
jgi:hypothetical protein